MPIQIYNTLTRSKEEFVPIRENEVGMYVCGPTVYSDSHIGHAKSYITFDVVRRYLTYRGYRVTYVQNITDVGHLVGDVDEGEDKIEVEARAAGASPYQIAQAFELSYWRDMDRLGIARPDISARATGHIIEQIALIDTLIAKGFAYVVDGSVYFDVSKDRSYGKLSNRKVEDMQAGARVGVREEKKHPADFALWKRADPTHIMQWPSPWGSGYPGWHIECSAMSMKYLGETIDIHGGGIENQFPHHECEIAQSECATGKPFVRYWMHHNMVNVGGQKMGKSLGNSAFLKDIFTEFEPLVLRFFLLQGHYRAPIEFQPDAIRAAGAGLEKLQTAARRLAARLADPAFVAPPRKDVAEPLDASAYRRRFEEAMDDDFNTPIAIGVLFNLAHETNRRLESGAFSRAEMDVTNLAFRTLGGDVLGIIPADHNAIAGPSIDAELIQLFIKLRAEARSRKDFATSDRIRDGLDQIGIALEDGKDGTSWKRI